MIKHSFFIGLFLHLCYTSIAQRSRTAETVFYHELEFPSLFRLGQQFDLIPRGSEDTNSTGKGNFIFQTAKIADIARCYVKMHTTNQKITYYQLVTYSKKNTENLYRQLLEDFGEPSNSASIEKSKIFRWKSVELGAGIAYGELIICNDGEEAEFRNWKTSK